MRVTSVFSKQTHELSACDSTGTWRGQQASFWGAGRSCHFSRLGSTLNEFSIFSPETFLLKMWDFKSQHRSLSSPNLIPGISDTKIPDFKCRGTPHEVNEFLARFTGRFPVFDRVVNFFAGHYTRKLQFSSVSMFHTKKRFRRINFCDILRIFGGHIPLPKISSKSVSLSRGYLTRNFQVSRFFTWWHLLRSLISRVRALCIKLQFPARPTTNFEPLQAHQSLPQTLSRFQGIALLSAKSFEIFCSSVIRTLSPTYWDGQQRWTWCKTVQGWN